MVPHNLKILVFDKSFISQNNEGINLCKHIFSRLLPGGSRRMLLRGLIDCPKTEYDWKI